MGIENGKAHGLGEAKGRHIHLFFPGQSVIPTFNHPDNHRLPIHYPEAVLPGAVEWIRFESSPCLLLLCNLGKVTWPVSSSVQFHGVVLRKK